MDNMFERYPITIIYAEDEITVRELIAKRLTRIAKEVYIGENGQEAWEHFMHHKPDILITDLTMPKMNGLELIAKVRALYPTLPIIVTTAHSDTQFVTQLFDHHVNYFLLKPYNFGKLQDSIAEIYQTLSISRQRDDFAKLSEEYRRIIDENNIVSRTDLHGRITYVNDLFCQETGYSREELIGKPHNILRHNDTPKEFYQEMWATILAKQSWRGILKNTRKNGTNYVGDITISPIFDTQGEISEFISIRRDISDIIETRNRILEERNTIELLLNMQESMVIFGVRGEGIMKANRAFLEFFGVKTLEDFHEKHLSVKELFLPIQGYVYDFPDVHWVDYINAHPDIEHKVQMMDTSGKRNIFSIQCRDGVLNNKPFYIATLNNITVFEEAMAKAIEADKLKSLFLANMSHEIRTPMNAVLGFVELLKSTELSFQQREFVSTIHSSAEALLRVINDILDFSKIENNSIDIESIPFNIVKELEGTIELFGTKAEEKDIILLVNFAKDLPEKVVGDPMRIKQVLSNLLSNAIKFTPSGKKITIDVRIVSCSDTRCHIFFAVQDEGIGIPEDKLEAIFNPFVQTDASVSRQYGGTGLGLSISRKLVSLMGGKLEVESLLGRGSVFGFSLELDVVKKSQNQDLQTRVSQILKQQQMVFIKPTQKVAAQEKFLLKWLEEVTQNTIEELRPLEVNPMKYNLIVAIYEKERKEIFSTLLQKNSSLYMVLIATHKEYDELDSLSGFDRIKVIFTPLYYYKLIRQFDTLSHDPIHQTTATKKDDVIAIETKVLVAEDDTTNQRLITLLLGRFGIKPTVVDNGQLALDEMAKTHYDLVLMDINMPVMDGLSAVQNLRRREQHDNNLSPHYVVALTANAIKGDKEHFLNEGFNNYLSKPIQTEELKELLLQFTTPIISETLASSSTSSDNAIHTQTQQLVAQAIALASTELGLPEEMIWELFGEMVSNLAPDITHLEEVIHKHDLTAIYQTAHKIKGVMGNMRFKEYQAMALTIEKEAKSENSSFDYLTHFTPLKEGFNALESYNNTRG